MQLQCSKRNLEGHSVTKIFNQSRKDRKDKRKLSILPTYFLVVKSIAPAPPPSGQHIFANLKSSQEKKYYSQKFAREIQKIIMFLLTVQQNIQIFSFFFCYI